MGRKSWYEANIARGKCKCGRDRTPGYRSCDRCRIRNTRHVREARKRRLGLVESECTMCLSPDHDYDHCPLNADYIAELEAMA